MSDTAKLDILGKHQPQGMIRASITRLCNKVEELAAKERLSPVDQLAAKRLLQRLKNFKEDFKCLHFTIVDLIEL